MSLIEGIGDEVVEFFIGLVIIIIGIVAWWSTRIAERPLIRTVLVFERRAQNHRSQTSSTQNSSSTSDERQVQPEQRNYVRELPGTDQEVSEQTAETEENKPPAASTSVNADSHSARDMTDRNREGPSAEEEQSAIVESMDSDACVLRRRRLEFFQSRQETLIASPTTNDTDAYDAVDSSNTEQLPETSNTDADSESMEENLPPSRSESTETTETTVDEDDIRIKLKYINDDLKLVNGKLQEPLGDFKRRHFEFELANDKLVRLIFNGQVLQRDDVTLQGCGMFDNCVVHCLVHQKRNTPGERNTGSGSNLGSTGASSGNDSTGRGLNSHSNSQQQAREWDLGNLFFAIVSFVLGAAWYFRYEYAQLYTVTATVALVGLTGIFTVLLVGMYFPDPEPPVQPMHS